MNKYAKLSGAAIVASVGVLALAPTATADTTMALFEHDTVQHQTGPRRARTGPG